MELSTDLVGKIEKVIRRCSEIETESVNRRKRKLLKCKENIKFLNTLASTEPIKTYLKEIGPINIMYLNIAEDLHTPRVPFHLALTKVGVCEIHYPSLYKYKNIYGFHELNIEEWSGMSLEKLANLNEEKIMQAIEKKFKY